MITDPLHDVRAGARGDSLSRGFSHLSNPHTSPLLSSVGAMPARGLRSAWPGSHFGTGGLRISLTLPCNTTKGVVQ